MLVSEKKAELKDVIKKAEESMNATDEERDANEDNLKYDFYQIIGTMMVAPVYHYFEATLYTIGFIVCMGLFMAVMPNPIVVVFGLLAIYCGYMWIDTLKKFVVYVVRKKT
jgi:hypothetical protein